MFFTTYLLIRLIHWINFIFRSLSDFVIGTVLEPKFDIALVTGGCSGLGKELVSQLVNKKVKVVVLDITIPQEELRLPGVTYFQCDVSNREQVLDIQKEVQSLMGTVTILINNAAVATGKPLLDLSFQEIERTVQTNLMASFYTIKAYLPSMISLERGYIITIASVLGYMSPARLSAYGASKSGLIALHESLTYELASPTFRSNGIKTLLVCPGQISTTMFKGVRTPTQIFAPELDPKFVASYVVSAIAQGRRGEIKLPFYGKFLPLFRAFPWPIVALARKLSGIDESMTNFKAKVSRVASSVSSIISRSRNCTNDNSPAVLRESLTVSPQASISMNIGEEKFAEK
ncbi:hypothetical protein CANMA_000175 [Candida margitis]|uniref:uncharacterized protein n=1 Tax=Candida margitis TaxID=1775924 RepID=UPI002225D017|nr:uncharacterized protein CANMA_000175 [Candida margitis]KAI5970756.1 hypothetical protein CANMA_000175 [Candida margitis]